MGKIGTKKKRGEKRKEKKKEKADKDTAKLSDCLATLQKNGCDVGGKR